jgi:beta-xylosidase
MKINHWSVRAKFRQPDLDNHKHYGILPSGWSSDLFQDTAGNWWSVSLSQRSGPQAVTCPMGRETVLYPVTWHEGIRAVTSQVQGTMSGWPLPPTDMNLQGIGAFVSSPDAIDFAPGSEIPYHFLYWRFPRADSYTISTQGPQTACA